MSSAAKVVSIGDGCGDVLLYKIVVLVVSITEGATVVEVVVVVFSFSFVSLTGLSVGNFSYSGLMDGGNKIVVNVTACCVVVTTGFEVVR